MSAAWKVSKCGVISGLYFPVFGLNTDQEITPYLDTFHALGFLSFATNIGKNIGKNISKSLSSKCSQKLIDHAKRSATDGFKTAPKKRFKKQQKQLVIWLVIKLPTCWLSRATIKLQKSQKMNHFNAIVYVTWL